jgi:hypothetical protein
VESGLAGFQGLVTARRRVCSRSSWLDRVMAYSRACERYLWCGGRCVEGFELSGWDVAELAVEAVLVGPVDVLGDGDLDVVDAGPRALVADQFALKRLLNASARALS